MSVLLPVDEAIERILHFSRPVQEVELVPIQEALGRVLVDDQYSTVDVPPLDNSAMDGYAICWSDRDKPLLPVSQRIPAGQCGDQLQPGTVARIFTGAPIPEGADTVIMQEDTASEPNGIRLTTTDLRKGQHIRPKGQDITKNSVVLSAGKRLNPQDVGVLASVGIVKVAVYRRLRVAVLATGDELVEPGQALAHGQIYNSNGFVLSAMLQSLGCIVVEGGGVADNFEQTRDELRRLSTKVDVIVSSGGVSVGEEDHVKAAVEAEGELNLWKLNIKPGKPVAFGRVGQAAFFGLPGNPSSSFVTFCLLARPFLRATMGEKQLPPTTVVVESNFDWPGKGSRQEYLRARIEFIDGRTVASLYANQSSGVLLSTSWANALVVIAPRQAVTVGDHVNVLLLNELLYG